MKKIVLLLCVFFAFEAITYAQKPKTKQPSQAEVDKMMNDAMKGMSKEDAAMMKEMMKQQQGKPAAEQAVNLEEIFTSNKQLIPIKNSSKISTVKKQYSTAEVTATVNSMYSKLLAKGNAAQIAMAKKTMLVAKTCTALMDAANTAMLQGQPHTALLLSLKAVQTCPTNLVAQNNVAALLTQYGYPEQAIPFLQKINNEQKGNSTVLNNLAYAWLGLGDTEKAYQFAGASVRHNPQHPQSRLLCGIILEAEGKTEEAKQQIEIAKKFNNTSLTEQIGKNNGSQSIYPKMSWEELKKKISVYEYFPKGWRKTFIPTNNTLAYDEQFFADFKSDNKMRGNFSRKMDEIIRAKEKVNDIEMQKPGEMMKKAMATDPKTLEFTIMANRVMATIMYAYGEKVKEWDIREAALAKEHTRRWTEKIPGITSKMTCAQQKPFADAFHQKNMNEFNPLLFNFVEEVEEDVRFYYNAMATWTLLQSSPVNKEGVEITFLELVQDYGASSADNAGNWYWKYYRAGPVECNSTPAAIPEYSITTPKIPNSNCLVIFKIPSGFGSLNLSNKGFSASDNEYGITANSTNKSPTMSTSLGTSGSRVSEPGLNKDPYTNTSYGNTEPVLGTPDDDELTPLPKNTKNAKVDDEELTPLPKASEVNSNWNDDELVPLISDKDRDLRDARNTARELLNNAMSTSCDLDAAKKKKAEQLQKTLENLRQSNYRMSTREEARLNTLEIYEIINSTYPEEERNSKIAKYNRMNVEIFHDNSKVYDINMEELNNHRNLMFIESDKRRLKRVSENTESEIRIVKYLNSLTPEKREINLKTRDRLSKELWGEKTEDYEKYKFDYEAINKKYGFIQKELADVSTNNGLTPTQNNGLNLPGKIAGFVTGLFN